MPRFPIHVTAIAAVALLAALTTPAVAGAAEPGVPTLSCRSGDLRYPFRKGLPNDFGVFRLKIAGGNCRLAHRVAKKWMDAFEADIRRGRVRLRRRIEGFRFTTLAPNAPQTYRLKGARRSATIRFDYVVPNG